MPKATKPKRTQLVQRFRASKKLVISLVAVAVLAVTVGGYWSIHHASAAIKFQPLCLYEAASECLVSHGPGHQVTVQGSGYSEWEVLYGGISSAGYDVYLFQNESNHCLQAENTESKGSIAVTISSAVCNSNDNSERFEVTRASNPMRLRNVKWGKYLGTIGTNSGRALWLSNQGTGFFSGWEAPL